jgi:hypothetical protein
MPKAKASRKQLFQAALLIAGLTAADWAKQQGVSAAYLSLIVNGKRPHDLLNEKIDAFTRAHLEKHTAQVA